MVSHSLVDVGELFVVLGEGALSAFGSSDRVMGASTEPLQALRMFLFEDRSLFQECRKVLVAVSRPYTQLLREDILSLS